MFTKEELTNIVILLKRTNVTGEEAITLVEILGKIGAELKKMTAKVEELPEKKK